MFERLYSVTPDTVPVSVLVMGRIRTRAGLVDDFPCKRDQAKCLDLFMCLPSMLLSTLKLISEVAKFSQGMSRKLALNSYQR